MGLHRESGTHSSDTEVEGEQQQTSGQRGRLQIAEVPKCPVREPQIFADYLVTVGGEEGSHPHAE